MEKAKKIDLDGRPIEEKNTFGASCPIWIFGDKTSAENDLKNKFEVSDEIENKKNKSYKPSV